MTALLSLAARSAWNRRQTLALVVLSIALATLLLQTVDRVRNDVRESFSQSVSGTDLVVGARTGPVQLMLYAVFHLGGATNNIHMSSLQAIAQQRAVDWVVPLSLGDSHRGYSVLGTTPDYFQRFRYGDRDALAFTEGHAFAGDLDALYDAVAGAEVAQALGGLWQVVGVGEKVLLALSAIVALVSLAGLVAVVLAGLNERRRELAVLRAVGAGPRHVLLLLAGEGALVTLLGALIGVLATVLLIGVAGPSIQSQFGVVLKLSAP